MKDSTLYLLDIVRYYLKVTRKTFNDTELCKVLLSDPTFPSLASICRTFEFYGFKTEAYKTDKTDIDQVKDRIIHTSSHGGHFFIVLNVGENDVTLFDSKRYVISKVQFLNLWDGIMLVINASKDNKANIVSNDFKHTLIVLLSIVACVSFMLLISSLLTVVNIFLDVVGIYLCMILIRRRIGFPQSGEFCKIGEKFDCDYVSSKQPLYNKIPISLDEVGLFYFGENLLVGLISESNIFTVSMSFIAAFVSILLAAYQIIGIKKYCIYCFCIYVICFTEGFFAYFTIGNLSELDFPKSLAMNLPEILIAIVICVLYTKLEWTKYKSLEKSIELLKIKRIPDVYRALSDKRPILDKNPLSGLKYGNDKAACEIVIFASLSCKYCRETIKEISILIEKFPEKFKCMVILTKSTVDGIDYSKELSLVEDYLQGHVNINTLLTKELPVKRTEEISNTAKSFVASMDTEISNFPIASIPFVVINGYKMPNTYKLTDYQYINSGVYM